MPEALVEPCVLAGSKAGDTILDPFTGSGTVAVVAERHGRSFVGAELNPEYVQVAWLRIAGARIATQMQADNEEQAP
jgi:DNA modification methylase